MIIKIPYFIIYIFDWRDAFDNIHGINRQSIVTRYRYKYIKLII